MAYKYTYGKPRKSEGEAEETEEIKFPFGEIEKKPYKQYNQTFVSEHVHFYISKPIGEPEAYADMIHRMNLAQPADVIHIHLNTPGGQLDTGVQIINAMKNSQAKIVTILESTAYSLGTLIFLSGDEMVVNEHCMMMFHNFNGGLIGKGNELVSELEATVKWFAALAEDIYIPFLSRDEFNRIARGEDMWMQTPEIKVRLAKLVESMAAKREAEEQELLRQHASQLAKDAQTLLESLKPPPKTKTTRKSEPNYRKGPARPSRGKQQA